MKLHAEASAVRIASYGPGYFVVGDRTVRHSIILTFDGAIEPWAPAASADLDEDHLRALLLHRPEVALLGTGARQAFPPAGVLRPFAQSGLGLEVMDTPAACRTWNVLAAEGRKVVAGLLPIGPPPPERSTPAIPTGAGTGER